MIDKHGISILMQCRKAVGLCDLELGPCLHGKRVIVVDQGENGIFYNIANQPQLDTGFCTLQQGRVPGEDCM